MRLLLAEDDEMLGAGLKRTLQRVGYTVDWAMDGEEAIAAAKAQDYALILLDLGLPRVDGMEALHAIRAQKDLTPIIILTARDRPEQKVGGLDGGADDYVVKPFDLEELLARIRAQIRHRERRASDVLATHGVQIDLAARTATLHDQPVALTAKEFKVLAVLMRRMGQFVSKDELEAALYDAAAEVESNTIEVAIYGLRRKLGAELIVTARGLGYMAPRQP
ncbi:response regulator transcription factor [Phenylobacterium aquaticum]|uniref:response regulator transcription factor n=1 Tax=Phenylobacterium aquaticum TaxID=1763816 RepID=UPI001F5E01D7|nr:response regulator transcription factor [Phenylobacterium aquaticum]MCI3135170.1 response regulator transcription factor [Phenylobacterium aquaticum]